ncbi:inner membrane protein YpjD [Endozoicomonas montiporae]|nr:cytochrome c biogenesis protein CcsA [Endozoicomonas montiporae]AMO56083.1 cytochrome c assembly protein [Endozoicomonas montiporae CL-33]
MVKSVTAEMNVMLASIGAFVFYSLGAFTQGRRVFIQSGSRQMVLAATAVGAVFQTVALYFSLHGSGGINLGLFNIASLSTLMVTMVVLLSSLKKPSESLFLLILPFTILTVLLAWLAPVDHIVWRPPSMMVAHVLLSVLAYGILMVAAFQALMLSYQERQLKHHNRRKIMQALPPLQTMEKLLFEYVAVGLILLTLALMTGFLFMDDMFATRIIHKTVLSIMAWGLFATLLIGRKLYGWRGQTAMRWTVAGLVMLMVAYFGWHLMVELWLSTT